MTNYMLLQCVSVLTASLASLVTQLFLFFLIGRNYKQAHISILTLGFKNLEGLLSLKLMPQVPLSIQFKEFFISFFLLLYSLFLLHVTLWATTQLGHTTVHQS